MILIEIFRTYTPKGHRWFIHLQDGGNGEILLHSEGYNRKASAVKAANKIKREAGSAEIVIIEPEDRRSC